jgi:hypothetical protein
MKGGDFRMEKITIRRLDKIETTTPSSSGGDS